MPRGERSAVVFRLAPSLCALSADVLNFAISHVSRIEESYLLIGTSTGHLQIHTDEGALLHRQRLHTSPVTAISLRTAGMQISSDDTSEDATVCFEDAVACVSSIEVRHLDAQCHDRIASRPAPQGVILHMSLLIAC